MGNLRISCSGSAWGKQSQLTIIAIESSSSFCLCASCDQLTRVAAVAALRFTALWGFTQLNLTRWKQMFTSIEKKPFQQIQWMNLSIASGIWSVLSVAIVWAIWSLYKHCRNLLPAIGWTPGGSWTSPGRPFVADPVHNLYGHNFHAKAEFQLCFFYMMCLLASSGVGLQLAPDWFAADCEVVGIRIRTSKSYTMVLSCKKGGSLCHSWWPRRDV